MNMIVELEGNSTNIKYCESCEWHHDGVEVLVDKESKNYFTCLLTKDKVIIS